MPSFHAQCLLIIFLFLSVRSDVNSDLFSDYNGYEYPPPPLPPVQLDEPSPSPPIYVPPLPPIFSDEPSFIPPSSSPPISYLPPQSSYLPPANEILPPNDDSIVIPAPYPPSQGLQPPQIRIQNMSCTQDMNFHAVFKMATNSPLFPVVDDATEGCITPLTSNTFRIDLENFGNMLKCGVRRCVNARGKSEGGENMCVVVRIPAVRGVRLPEDGVVTLMCTPQERVVSQTKHVKLGTNRIQQISRGRSNNGLVATGGSQKGLKTRIGIFRRRAGSNIFDQTVKSDNVIQLGEELVLRAIVNEGDGWKSSQIGPVLVTGLNSKKSALLVNQQGCVNPTMKTICPSQPVKVNPLCTELHFRAFLFQDSPQGDEMVVSVRTQGCLHLQDCLRNEPCKDDPSTHPLRSKRELFQSIIAKNDTSEEIENWESELSFKVAPFAKRHQELISDFDSGYLKIWSISFLGVVLGVIFVGFIVWLRPRSKLTHIFNNTRV